MGGPFVAGTDPNVQSGDPGACPPKPMGVLLSPSTRTV